ncbi:hypothetical protein C7S16_1100 [Burkholderia thailandensis]|uniref:Uncharacterized protein n=1 Tax=Burkholderia thailandensis TaxID=57975 RepID=A0AAW9D5K2_BURTH|nr:hypothetical protein [Burkholderia thailandensis]MDW9257241.1 hypothetical protein [Burkholderia thailandensis]
MMKAEPDATLSFIPKGADAEKSRAPHWKWPPAAIFSVAAASMRAARPGRRSSGV